MTATVIDPKRPRMLPTNKEHWQFVTKNEKEKHQNVFMSPAVMGL